MKINRKILCAVLTLILLILAVPSVSALPPAPTDPDGNPYPYSPLEMIDVVPSDGDGKYEEYFVEYLNSQYENEDFQYYYDELFEYSEDNCATPDCVIVQCYKDYIASHGEYRMIVDGLVFVSQYHHCPDSLGLFVFVPETTQILTVAEAIESIPDIGKVLSESGACRVLGDANNDGVLNIKDVTAIQKKLAGLITLEDEYLYSDSRSESNIGYYSDFNCDNKLNIKDATAIQKYLAKV